MSREFLPGQVIDYPYLWAWQDERGETEGRKNRPTCVVVAVRSAKTASLTWRFSRLPPSRRKTIGSR